MLMMMLTSIGSDPRIIVLARASLAIARALARIARRRRSTSERLFSVSARLPPVSRCTFSAIMKKRNSGAVIRFAMSHNRLSRSRPTRMPASMPRSSAPSGSPISWPALMMASVTGRAGAQRPHHQVDRFRKQRDKARDAFAAHAADDVMRKEQPDRRARQQARNEAEAGEDDQ